MLTVFVVWNHRTQQAPTWDVVHIRDRAFTLINPRGMWKNDG